MWDYQKINGAVLTGYLHNYKLKEHELEMETMGHFDDLNWLLQIHQKQVLFFKTSGQH